MKRVVFILIFMWMVAALPVAAEVTEQYVDAAVTQSIRIEAGNRITAQTPPVEQRRFLARGVELLLIRIQSGAWTTAEQGEVDALLAVLQWTRDTRQAAQDAIDSLATMTKEQKIAFEPRTDIPWPAAPGK